MKIEDILTQLQKKGASAIAIMKANEGYSVVPVNKNIYRTVFLLEDHYNGETIEKALLKLLNKEK